MQAYDVALKLLLQQSARLTMRQLTGAVIEKWLDVELPKVQNPRADILGETVDGTENTGRATRPSRILDEQQLYPFGAAERCDEGVLYPAGIGRS